MQRGFVGADLFDVSDLSWVTTTKGPTISVLTVSYFSYLY